MTKNKIIIAMIIVSVMSCLMTSCKKDNRNARLATNVALVSTYIQETIQADWSPTPENTATSIPTWTMTPKAIEEAIATDGGAPEISMLTPTLSPITGTPTPDLRPMAATWREWPIVPEISDNAKRIYLHGVNELGANPKHFSKIGDCHSYPDVFMGIYDTEYYSLSTEDQNLKAAIDYFKGSFSKESLAVHNGMSVASVLTTAWADPAICKAGESALDCEIRVNNPSIMFVNLGSNWISGLSMDVYYDYLSQVIQILIDHGILPILTSKADNAEGGHMINEITAQAARDFDIPFYNFYQYSQYLNNGGIDPDRNDGVHLSVVAWNWRNYYALKTLYGVGHSLELF